MESLGETFIKGRIVNLDTTDIVEWSSPNLKIFYKGDKHFETTPGIHRQNEKTLRRPWC